MKSKDKDEINTQAEEESCTEPEEEQEKEEIEEVNAGPETSAEEKLTAMLEEAKDKFLRKVAEFDNFKKRTAKEKAENFAMGACDAVEKLLPVLDNLDRAISAAETNDDKEALIEGIKMVRNQFADALSAIGVSEIEAVDKEFNPEKHNAVMMEDSEKPSGTITEEFAKGYIYNSGGDERVIRHSMVKVAN